MRTYLSILAAGAIALWPAHAPAQSTPPKAAIVRIVATVNGSTKVGTGFIVRLDRDAAYIVTASHVIEGDAAPKVEFFTRQNFPQAGRVAPGAELADPRGLAIVIVDAPLPSGLASLPIAERPIALEGGEDVSMIGHPQRGGRWAVIRGYVTSREGRVIYIDAAIDAGNSGGPLISGGKVVGVVTGKGPTYGEAVSGLALTDFLAGSGVRVPDASAGPARPSPPEAQQVPQQTTRARPETAAWSPGQTLKDCADYCPEMVVVPAGRFQMGSWDGEKGRSPNEGPVHQVTIPATFAVSKFEITRGQFARFVRSTGRGMSGGCSFWDDKEGKPKLDSARSWLDAGFAQSDEHPVVCVSFEDATGYAQWLAKQTGKPYRLLSEAEWEYAARAGTTTSRYWGDGEQQACEYANVGDRGGKAKHPSWVWPTFDCDDGYAETAPVGKYKTHAFGLYDMLGNAWEWVQDCWNDSYKGAPTNGSAWLSKDCDTRVVRGGSWLNKPVNVRSAIRVGFTATTRFDYLGFRVARTLP